MAEIEFIDEMRWASMAFATSFESSEDQVFIVTIRFLGTQEPYTEARVSAARRPAEVDEEPIITRSGESRSVIAVPAARNSGLERTSKDWVGRWTLSCTLLGRFLRWGERAYCVLDELCRSTGYCTLFYEDCPGLGVDGYFSRHGFQSCKICCLPGTHSPRFCRCIDSNEYDICLADCFRDLGREEEVRYTCLDCDFVSVVSALTFAF